jgi:hypothetical protein
MSELARALAGVVTAAARVPAAAARSATCALRGHVPDDHWPRLCARCGARLEHVSWPGEPAAWPGDPYAIAPEDRCPRCFGKGLEGQDDRPGILLDPDRGTDECRACGGTGRRAG